MVTSLHAVLDSAQRRRAVLVLLGLGVSALVEMAGMAAVPAFVVLVIEPERLLSAIPTALGGLLRPLSAPTLILCAAGALTTIFLFKNAYAAALIGAENALWRDVGSTLAKRLFSNYLYSPYTFHLQRNPAQLMANISTETSQAVTSVRSLVMMARESLVLAVVFVLLLVVDPIVSLSVFVLLGAAAALFYASVRRQLSARGALIQRHRAAQLRAMTQGLGSIRDAKILGCEPHLLALFTAETDALEGHELYQRVVSALPRLFLEVVAISAVLLVSVTFSLLGRSAQTMLPVLALLAVAAARLVPAFNGITASLAMRRYCGPSLDRIARELSATPRAQSHPRPPSGSCGILRSALTLQDVRYRYPDAAVDALCGISLSIRPGEAVGFIGATAAGKSTLVDVILGLLEPTAGVVAVDGWDIHNDVASWQRQIGYVPQDIYLIDDTIRRNIAFGRPDALIDEQAVARAVATAHLDADIERMPEGLDTVIGHRGVRLSGGQRQRIGIARALYHDPGVLVMDEATSSLDHETEREVVAAIGRLRGAKTLIMIAHRLTTVQGCDRLYVLDHGYIVDQGSFMDLAQRHALPGGVPAAQAAGRAVQPWDGRVTTE
jgi:ATP-binding cassette subfamily C protein